MNFSAQTVSQNETSCDLSPFQLIRHFLLTLLELLFLGPRTVCVCSPARLKSKVVSKDYKLEHLYCVGVAALAANIAYAYQLNPKKFTVDGAEHREPSRNGTVN